MSDPQQNPYMGWNPSRLQNKLAYYQRIFGLEEGYAFRFYHAHITNMVANGQYQLPGEEQQLEEIKSAAEAWMEAGYADMLQIIAALRASKIRRVKRFSWRWFLPGWLGRL